MAARDASFDRILVADRDPDESSSEVEVEEGAPLTSYAPRPTSLRLIGIARGFTSGFPERLQISKRYGRGMLAATLVLAALCGGVAYVRQRNRKDNSRNAALQRAMDLVAPADLGTFGKRLSDHTEGKDWNDICYIYQAVACSGYGGADPEIKDLNEYFNEFGPSTEKAIMEGVMQMSKNKHGISCPPCYPPEESESTGSTGSGSTASTGSGSTASTGSGSTASSAPAPTPDINDG